MTATVSTNNLMMFTCDKVSNPVMFHKFDPPALSLDNLTHNTWDSQGKLVANNGGAANPLHGEWGMERVVDTNADLWTWFQNTQQQGREAQKSDVTVTIMQQNGTSTTTLGKWQLNGSTPVAYSHAGHDANSNAVMTESIRFYATEVIYTPGG